MSECDPENHIFTVQGVEFCMLDLRFSNDPAATMERALELIKEKGGDPVAAVVEIRREVLKRFKANDRDNPFMRDQVRSATYEDLKSSGFWK